MAEMIKIFSSTYCYIYRTHASLKIISLNEVMLMLQEFDVNLKHTILILQAISGNVLEIVSYDNCISGFHRAPQTLILHHVKIEHSNK